MLFLLLVQTQPYAVMARSRYHLLQDFRSSLMSSSQLLREGLTTLDSEAHLCTLLLKVAESSNMRVRMLVRTSLNWCKIKEIFLAFADRKDAENDGRRSPARNWYEDFLVLLRDADSDVPIYQQAQSVYAKLAKNPGIFRRQITEHVIMQ